MNGRCRYNSGDETMRQHKQGVYNIIALCIGIGIALILAELIVRVFSLAPGLPKQYRYFDTDSDLPYIPKPNTIFSGTTQEFDYEYIHNSLGFRDAEHPFSKPRNVFRILAIGDSFTYGVGASYEETYLYQLEEMLNTDDPGATEFEIVKMGIPTYFPEAERILLQKYGKLFSPDLILVAFLPNDVFDTYFGLRSITVDKSGFLKSREAEKIGFLGMKLYFYSHFFRIVLKKYIDFQLAKEYSPKWEDIYKADGFHEKDWEKIECEYERMISLADALRAEIIFTHIPQKGPWEVRHFYPSERLSQWCDLHNIGFIDTLPAIIEAAKMEPLYYEQDGHCRPEGYRIIAKAIYDYLEQKNVGRSAYETTQF